MAPVKPTGPLRNGGQLSLASPSNAMVAGSDRPIRLENALKAFRDVLTDKEQDQLRAEMAVARDAGQVIAFTAGLDLVDPNRRGRSIATRLHSILQTVLQFSQVVDTYVSSHPEIAALVWGSVRLAFTVGFFPTAHMSKSPLTKQVLANFTSFFQTFSDLLDGFDTLTPQFKEYQILFPDSLSLRNSVYDFHSAIISCCAQVISSTRRTWSQKAWASLTTSFDAEIRPRVAEIREKAELVKSQAALAKAQDDSRRQASLAAEFQRQEKERKWNSLLLKLSSYDHGSAFNQARSKMHRGTAEWIFSTSRFQDWRAGTDSSVLNVSGKIGSGKTILAANIVSYLLQKAPPNCSVSYLFVRFDDRNSQLADMILRSLIFQALNSHNVQDNIMELLEKSASHSFERDSLLSLLGPFISSREETFLVVDGVDQCPPEEQHSLLQAFSRLMQMCTSGGLKILISARDSMTKEVHRALGPTEHLRIGLAETNADLARYAEEILAEKRETGRLVLGDEAIMNQIVNKLRTGGEGMFLWAFLTIEDICSCPTDEDIRQTLEILPRKLSDTFDRALGRIIASQSSSIVDLVQRTFKWVATVRRPVTRWELGEALGVKILQKSLIKDQIINGTERIPGWCENLIQIEDGDETVRFFHHSIKTHLLGTKLESTELEVFHVDLEAWDHQVGEVCMTYLNFSDFERALAAFTPHTNSSLIRQIAISNEGRSIPAAVGGSQLVLDTLPETGRHTVAQLLRRLLKTSTPGEKFQVLKSVPKPAESPSGDNSGPTELFPGYPFFRYATNFWFDHTFNFRPHTTKTWKLWGHRVNKSILEDDKLWANFGRQPPGFETFDLQLADADTSILKVSGGKKFNNERMMLHKAIIFADFIAHRALLTHVLTAVRDRGHDLVPELLRQFLPTRRVFQFPRERKEYLRDENPHDGLLSLVTEFIACGDHTDIWPRNSSPQGPSSCPWGSCGGKPLHDEMMGILSGSGYPKELQPWLHLFAKIVALKLTKETSDAIEVWVNSKKPCIHEVQTLDNRDIIDTILATAETSSFQFARWASDLHENCVGGWRYDFIDWRSKLQAALRNWKMISVEFYLQQAEIESKEDNVHCRIDSDLWEEITKCRSLSPDVRIRAMSIAILGVSHEKRGRACDVAIITGNWYVLVELLRQGLKLASTVSRREAQSWFQVLEDVLHCVSSSSITRCDQAWSETGSQLVLCASHIAKAKQAWRKPFPAENDHEQALFNSLYRTAATQGP